MLLRQWRLVAVGAILVMPPTDSTPSTNLSMNVCVTYSQPGAAGVLRFYLIRAVE